MAQLLLPITPTRLYRYRSLERNEETVEQEIESIIQNYLYCSPFTKMNDPMEGFYRPSELLKGREDYKRIVSKIIDLKSNIGLACFTESFEDILMWTHYAGNHTGMCLGYSTKQMVSGLPRSASLVRLSYVDDAPLIYPSHVRNAEDAAIRILSQKKYNWAYEREWRVLGPLGRMELGNIQAVQCVYFGSRVNLRHRQRILSKIQGTAIKAYMMKVDGYSHEFKPVNVAARRPIR